MKRYLYDNGLPFSSKLGENLNDLQDRVSRNKASMILVDGVMGEGKTTLGIHILKYIQNSDYELKSQYGMGGLAFQEKLQICIDLRKKSCAYDEGGDFSKKRHMTNFNLLLNRIFETYRAFRIIIIIILPCFDVLDEDMFKKGIPRLLLHCYDRNNFYGNFMGFSLRRMYYIKDKFKKVKFKPDAYFSVEPNFYGHFLDLRPEEAAELDAMSIKGKKEIVTESILASRGLISIDGIALKLKKSRRSIQYAIQKTKVKPKQRYQKKNYYDGTALNRIEVYFIGNK